MEPVLSEVEGFLSLPQVSANFGYKSNNLTCLQKKTTILKKNSGLNIYLVSIFTGTDYPTVARLKPEISTSP